MAIDFPKLEAKWQAAWAAAKIGQAKANRKKPKFFMIFAYPYPSGYQHVGHFKGYTYADIITRYKRMRGFNVLFPVGVHASGNIALAFALKVQKKDSEWLAYLRRNGATEDEIAHMTNPYKVVEHFNKAYIETWKRFGFLADYDRFICTVSPDYNKFIQWQFLKLYKAGLLTQGPYFGTFCPTHGPVAVDPSETDIAKGGSAEKVEYVLLKFKFGTEFIIAATLRPETIFGQTNLWVNPDVEYEKALVDDEVWIGSHEFFEKLKEQKDKITIMSKVPARELIGKYAVAPGIDRKIPILPATFVSPFVGSGIVTSVPADAPYDYIALEELKQDATTLKKFGLKYELVKNIEPISIIKTKGYGDFPAAEICQKLGIRRQTDPALEEATAEIYKLGFHTGVMKENAGHYANLPVPVAKEKIAKDLMKKGLADIFYDLSEEVLCRCGLRVVIKKIPDQWFIKYSDESWKSKAKTHIKDMTIWPAEYAKNLPGIIDWFQDRSCARLGNWLGTRLPFDERWIIEPIGDSTLYPAYYIVSKYVNSGKLKTEELTEQFFDYVFLGKGRPKHKIWKTIREDFLYWYPLDINLGGKEHQTVHFPVFILNHVAILNKEQWPKGIFVHWWIIGKGGKISKSKGGAQPIPGAIEQFSVDGMRLYYAHGTSAFEDAEWDENVVATYRKQVEKIVTTVKDLVKLKGKQNKTLDSWLISKVNTAIKKATESFEQLDLRKTVDIVLFDFINNLQWYQRRGGGNKKLLKQVLSCWLKLLAPFTPHIAEELWQKLGNKGLIAKASWPSFNERRIKPELETAEKTIEQTFADIRNILKIVGKPAKQIYLYVIPKELSFYKEAEKFLSKELATKVKVWSVADPKKKDPQNKASKAKPGKPGIYIET
ncbi:MAG: leucine--tRNA ligase [Candidatus Nanoarchaeia archaeon]